MQKVLGNFCMNVPQNMPPNTMLAEFWEFDRKMIHEKYKSVVEDLRKQQ